MERPRYFQDTMIRGAFLFMQHDHFFIPLSGDVTEMRDVFRFAAPLAVPDRLAEVLALRRYMQNLLRERNRALKKIAESGEWRGYLSS